uniref:DNA complex-sensing repressor n=1 Tax=Podoviridae sp. ctzMH52 TaxID=2826596 RepID=A0A8S5N2C4_9CAUD|nr:MAG TPA: DNA complex-sensing repressor [Podoviridae sp. ctzMH52]
MKPEELIRKTVKERGMTITAASKMSGVKYSRLQPALGGAAELRADEYISLCLLLDVDPRAYRDMK